MVLYKNTFYSRNRSISSNFPVCVNLTFPFECLSWMWNYVKSTNDNNTQKLVYISCKVKWFITKIYNHNISSLSQMGCITLVLPTEPSWEAYITVRSNRDWPKVRNPAIFLTHLLAMHFSCAFWVFSMDLFLPKITITRHK